MSSLFAVRCLDERDTRYAHFPPTASINNSWQSQELKVEADKVSAPKVDLGKISLTSGPIIPGISRNTWSRNHADLATFSASSSCGAVGAPVQTLDTNPWNFPHGMLSRDCWNIGTRPRKEAEIGRLQWINNAFTTFTPYS